jgi:hypothetical protein
MKNQNLSSEIKCEEERLAIIKAIVKKVQSGDSECVVDQDLLDEFKSEKATEDFVVEHGLLDATEEDVRDEVGQLASVDHEKDSDFDADENEVDMENVSLEMRGMFS